MPRVVLQDGTVVDGALLAQLVSQNRQYAPHWDDKENQANDLNSSMDVSQLDSHFHSDEGRVDDRTTQEEGSVRRYRWGSTVQLVEGHDSTL